MDIRGQEIVIAEALSGPLQTLMRMEADIDEYSDILQRIQPELATEDLATRIWSRAR